MEKEYSKIIEIYELDPAHFLSATVLESVLESSFKKTEIKLILLTNFDMFLMVEKKN